MTDRYGELLQLAKDAYSAGERKRWKMLSWCAQQLDMTGKEPSESAIVKAWGTSL